MVEMKRSELLEDLEELLELMQKNNVNLKDQAENILFLIEDALKNGAIE